MKRNAYNTTLLALVAFCCLCSACTGDPSQATNSETETTEASITIEDEDEIITPDFSDESSGDILPSVEPTTSDADVLPSDVVPSDPLQDPVTASVINALEPILNPILVAVFYGEILGTLSLIGAVIVIGGILFYNLTIQKGSGIEPMHE